MSAFIARSALTTLLLEAAQAREPGVNGLWLEHSTGEARAGNWIVAKIEVDSTASERSAHAAVEEAVRQHAAWIMVADGDQRDGEPANGCSGKLPPG